MCVAMTTTAISKTRVKKREREREKEETHGHVETFFIGGKVPMMLQEQTHAE